MRLLTHFILLLTGLSFLTVPSGCDDNSVDAAVHGTDEYIQIPVLDSQCSSFVEERETVDTYEEARGKLEAIEVGRDDWQIVIAPERISDYMFSGVVQVCNLPDTLAKRSLEGCEVIFSGILKEVYPTENMPGNPFKLTAIRVGVPKDRSID